MSTLITSLGSALSLALYSSAVYGVLTKARRKTLNGGNALAGCSPVPYVALLVSCFLWTQYSILIHDSALICINSIGVLFSLAAAAIFHRYTDNKERTETIMLRGLACLYPILLYVRYQGTTDALSKLGAACAASSLFMIVSPLAVLPQVLETRSTALLSFPLALCSLLSCIIWTYYGTLLSDPYISWPNGVGAIASAAQVLLFAIYGRSSNVVMTGPGVVGRGGYNMIPQQIVMEEKTAWIV